MATRNRPGIGKEVLATLKKQIATAHWDSKLPAIDALAEEFGVNRKTIDRALMTLVRDGLLVRQRGVGTFIAGTEPEPSGSNRKINTRRYAALAQAQTTYPGYMDLLHGCSEVLDPIDGSLMFVRFDANESDEKTLGRLRLLKLEGILFCGPIRDSLLRKIQKEFNILLIDSHSESPPVDSVVWECYDTGYRLATEIIKSGRESALILESTKNSANSPEDPAWFHYQRIKGIKKAFDEHGFNYMEYQTGWGYKNITRSNKVIKYLSTPADKKVLITTDSSMIVPSLKKANSLDAIGQIMLCSFADTRYLEQAFPGLYAVHNMHMMGNEAGKMLIDILGRPSQRTSSIKLVPKIIEVK